MSDDLGVPSPRKRGGDFIFYGVIAVVMIAVFGGAVYLLGGPGDSSAKPPTTTPGTNRSSTSAGPTLAGSRAAALAVVRKYFQLSVAGREGAACALESPAYLRFDAQTYSHGSCEAESRAAVRELAARGLSLKMTGARIRSFSVGEATVVVKVAVGSKALTERVYAQFHGDKWWITGGDDSGDLGY